MTPAWLTLLRHVMLARRRSGTALPERVRSRRGAGGCLLRAALLVLLLFVALVASVVIASTLVHAVLVAQPRYALSVIPLLVAGGASGLVATGRRVYAGSRSPRSRTTSRASVL